MFWWKRLKKYKKGDEAELQRQIEETGGLEKGDIPAMIGSALLTFLPVCALVLGGLGILALLMFGGL